MPGHVLLPTGAGLHPIPARMWESWDARQAVEQGGPGAVVAFARRAHGLNQARLGRIAGFSQSAISRLESGGNLAYDMRLLRIFQRLLGIPPHLLGLADAYYPADGLPAGFVPEPGAGLSVDCHTLAAACTSSVLGALPVDRSGELVEGRPVDPDVVRQLLVVRRLLNDSDNWLGSGDLARAAADMYELADRARRAATGELRRRLLGVAGLYAEFCGWLHQEVGETDRALAWTDRAMQLALTVDDRDLLAYVYVRLSQLAAARHDGDRMAGLAQAAVRESGAAPEVHALALQQLARAHAAEGDANACLTVLDGAEMRLADAARPEGDEYRVGYYVSRHHLIIERAACLVELGKSQEAIEMYHDTGDSRARLCRWEQGLHLAKLARAYADSGELEQAAVLGYEALAVGRTTGAAIVNQELRRLGRWRDDPTIAALTRALGHAESA